MPNDNFERYVTPSLIRDVFDGRVVDSTRGGWVITVAGKIVTINGKMIFNSREQAVKAFYNSFNWRATYQIGRAVDPNEEYWWRSANRSQYWQTFKTVLKRDYGFKVIKL